MCLEAASQALQHRAVTRGTTLCLEALESQIVALNVPPPTSERCHRPWNVLCDLPQALVYFLGAHRGVRTTCENMPPVTVSTIGSPGTI